MRKIPALAITVILLLSALIITAGGTDAWSDDFTPDGWDITGTRFSTSGSRLTFTDLPRTGTEIASHEFAEGSATDYNITFEIRMTSLSGNDGDMVYS